MVDEQTFGDLKAEMEALRQEIVDLRSLLRNSVAEINSSVQAVLDRLDDES